MQLIEGESIFLSTTLIDVLVDYGKYNVLESGVVFHIAQQPKHGKITILPSATEEASTDKNNTNPMQNKYFSLIELSTDKVKYTHNGMEQFTDHMTIDLQLISNNRDSLPEYIQGKHRFVLHANVTPVNDAPILNIPNNRILRMTQGIPRIIGVDILQAEDPDSPASSLMYSILASPDSDAQYGQIEVNGKVVATFSQADINLGTVTYMINKQVYCLNY